MPWRRTQPTSSSRLSEQRNRRPTLPAFMQVSLRFRAARFFRDDLQKTTDIAGLWPRWAARGLFWRWPSLADAEFDNPDSWAASVAAGEDAERCLGLGAGVASERAPCSVLRSQSLGERCDPSSVGAGEVGALRERVVDAGEQRSGVV